MDCHSTPQNTPANNAPISSHAQQPGVSSIKEGKLEHAPRAQPGPGRISVVLTRPRPQMTWLSALPPPLSSPRTLPSSP
jgi:hypothetical protein